MIEKCAKLGIDAAGNVQQFIAEIPCDPQVKTMGLLQFASEHPWILVGVVLLVIFVLFVLWGLVAGPIWNVWASKKAGEAVLQEAINTQRVQLAHAEARKEAATLNKEAAIIEASAVGEQIRTIGSELKDHNLFLQWQQIEMMKSHEGSIIYVPTEAGLPILEAGKRT
jgi:hypothetical protein